MPQSKYIINDLDTIISNINGIFLDHPEKPVIVGRYAVFVEAGIRVKIASIKDLTPLTRGGN